MSDLKLNVDAANEMLKWRAEVRDLLDDLLDYFEPRMEADYDEGWMPNKEMKFWTRIKEVRGER